MARPAKRLGSPQREVTGGELTAEVGMPGVLGEVGIGVDLVGGDPGSRSRRPVEEALEVRGEVDLAPEQRVYERDPDGHQAAERERTLPWRGDRPVAWRPS